MILRVYRIATYTIEHSLIESFPMSKDVAAVAQITSTSSVNRNMQVVVKLLTQAASRGAKMIFLPEAADL